MHLAGDIGGTKTELALYDRERGPHDALCERRYVSADYPSLSALLAAFVAETGAEVEAACLGVCGPVINRAAHVTNLPWNVDAREIEAQLGFSVRLLNDLEAIAEAVPYLHGDDLHELNEGKPREGATIAVIAPGTGLGEAFLVHDGTRYRAYPSEGGHADLAPHSPLECEFVLDLNERFGHASYERACSGIGLPNIYTFLKEKKGLEEPEWLKAQLAASRDPTPVIRKAAMDGERACPICEQAMDLFMSFLGGEVGNLALKFIAHGGVYLGGGFSPRLLPLFSRDAFRTALFRKGRMSHIVVDSPVRVILNGSAARLGAAVRAFDLQSAR